MLESLDEDQLNVLFEYEEEVSWRGGFELIFPKVQNIDYYSKFFSC